MMQKKRRNLKELGYMREMKGDCGNEIWGEVGIEEICCGIAVIVTSYVSVKIVGFDDESEMGERKRSL